MELLSVARRLIALGGITGALAAAHAGCSTTPTFVPEGSLGAGGASSSSSSGAIGGDCQTTDDCPGDENECAHRTCTGGKCGVDLAPAGFLVGAQTMGDCLKTTCDGKGAVTTVPDDADKPSDGNACTLDLCMGGNPSHPSAPKGTSCGATQQLTCDGAGSCAGCTKDTDCGVNAPCVSFTCDVASTTCKLAYVPSGGGDPGNQQTGDCKKNVCNGSGGTATQNDDGDVPNDGNACTTDTCSMGQASHSPAAAGMTCGGTFKCDGKGSCAGCVTNLDCGQDNACASFLCAGGSCQSNYVPAGQGDPGGQKPGDCKKSVCNGSGSPTTIADDSDVPSDGNVCTSDTCSNGVPNNTPLASGTGCGGNLKCDGAGSCKGCVANSDCGASSACVSNLCQGGACVTQNVSPGSPCGGNNQCDGGGNCVCGDPGACSGRCGTFNNACNVGVNCGGCIGAGSCGGGGTPNVCGCSDSGACSGKCGTFNNACNVGVNCGGCAGADTCGGGGAANVCGCTPTADCSGKCGLIPNGCGGTINCGDPSVACPAATACTPSYSCNGASTCTPNYAANGAACGASDQCGAPVCDGVGGCAWASAPDNTACTDIKSVASYCCGGTCAPNYNACGGCGYSCGASCGCSDPATHTCATDC